MCGLEPVLFKFRDGKLARCHFSRRRMKNFGRVPTQGARHDP